MVTVGWLARQPHLGLSVVAGSRHADREILWAHAIELADPAPYLSGGELVMTTGITVGTDPQAQSDYVARLVAADAAALAFDTGTNFTQVPPGIVAAGDALGLPVLRVAASTPFIAITRAVIDAINADQLKAVQRTVELQERLARETLRGGITAVVAALSRALNATTVVLSREGRLLAAAGSDQERVSSLTADLIRRGRSPAGRVVADGDGYCTVQTLRAEAAALGYLAVRSARALSSPDRLLVSHAVSLITIELEKPTQVLDAEQRLRAAVTRALIAGPDPAEPTVLRYFGFEPDAEVLAVVVSDVGPTLAAADHAQQALRGAGGPFLLSPLDDDIVLVVPAGEQDRIPLIYQELRDRLGTALLAGVSPVGALAGLGVMVQQARVAARTSGGEPLRHFDGLGVFEAILAGRTAEELGVLADVLQPLDDNGLLPTLVAFLEHNGHLESAAAGLGVHRHTMRNRVGRIGEILGQNLDSADIRAQLLIAVRAREITASAGRPGQ